MITREQIQELAGLYDLIPAVERDGKPALQEGDALEAFRTRKDELSQHFLQGMAEHQNYQDFTLNQLRKVSETVVSNMLAMIEVKEKVVAKARKNKRRRK